VRIAVLGWGSLISCPRELDTTTRWRPGPALPVEFARKSRDGRVTLVLVGEHKVHTFWSLSAKDDIEGSCENLRRREGKPRPGDIHYTTGQGLRTCRDEEPSPESRDVSGTVSEWLSTMPDLDAVVWTGLPPKGFTQLDQPGLANAVVDYLPAQPQSTSLEESRPTSHQQHPPASWPAPGWIESQSTCSRSSTSDSAIHPEGRRTNPALWVSDLGPCDHCA
jgi:hypothetical protein